MLTLLALALVLHPGKPKVEFQSIRVDGRSIGVTYLRMSLQEYEPAIAWPSEGLGATADMASIAKGAGAEAAINGCYFDAYLTTTRKNPNQNLLAGGRVIHIGGTGCTLGFDAQGNARIDRVRFLYRGWVSDGRSRQSWYAYRANDTPTGANQAGYYDSAYGSRLELAGIKIVVRAGRVVDVNPYAVDIPSDGYVIVLQGSEQSMGVRFHTGNSVQKGLQITGGNPAFWRYAVTGIGGGPKLLTNGEVDLRMSEEGFTNPKITSGSFSRSMVGIDGDGRIVVAVSDGTMKEMAGVMKGLGCVEAMNLDGGASSSLWVSGKGYVRAAGRPLTNLLVFRRRRS